MPLIDDTGLAADSWTRLSDEQPIPANAETLRLIVNLPRLAEALAAEVKAIGVDVPNTIRIAELAPHFKALSLITIAFPSFADGRGFSIARSLRQAGFKGELRAFGPLIADQFAHAKACGFSAVEVPEGLAERQPAGQWLTAARSLSLAYQRGYQRGATILDQRREARRLTRAA